jgi:hypothetical protein
MLRLTTKCTPIRATTRSKAALNLRGHNVEDYATLRDRDTTDVAVLDEADRACLDQLGQHLVSTDSWLRFPIWLLHKHFEPAEGEVFVERVTTAPRNRNHACRAALRGGFERDLDAF